MTVETRFPFTLQVRENISAKLGQIEFSGLFPKPFVTLDLRNALSARSARRPAGSFVLGVSLVCSHGTVRAGLRRGRTRGIGIPLGRFDDSGCGWRLINGYRGRFLLLVFRRAIVVTNAVQNEVSVGFVFYQLLLLPRDDDSDDSVMFRESHGPL